MSWIAVPIASLAVIIISLKDRSVREKALLPAIVVFLFVSLLIPYSMGRIDSGSFSRPGLIAIFGWSILIPIMIWALLQPKFKTVIILLVVAMGSVFNMGNISIANLISAVSPQVGTGPLRDSRSFGISNIGTAAVQDAQWDRLLRLNTLLCEKLAPGETYLDLTSRNAQYFYMNRLPAMAVTAPYNMVPLTQQQRAVASLSHKLPRLALLEADNIRHDGGSLALRNPILFRFVLEHFIPVWEDGFIVGYSQHDNQLDNADDDQKTSIIQVPVSDLTDMNWEKGINRQSAALVVGDPRPLFGLSVGDVITLGDGERRHITRIWHEGSAIWLDGAALDPLMVGAPNLIEISVNPIQETELRLALFDRAFTVKDLSKIPVSWGRSEASLRKKMQLINGFEQTLPVVHDLAFENNSYKINGDDPQMIFDISALNISGRDAGLLRFEFSCLNKKIEPRIQVFWWGDEQTGPTEASTLLFTADDGTLIVPLDAYPRWLALSNIHGLRIDLDNSSACESISIKNIALFQRNIFQ